MRSGSAEIVRGRIPISVAELTPGIPQLTPMGLHEGARPGARGHAYGEAGLGDSQLLQLLFRERASCGFFVKSVKLLAECDQGCEALDN